MAQDNSDTLASQGETLGERLGIATITIAQIFRPLGNRAGGLENELTVDHSGNAVVKTLTLSFDARESHRLRHEANEQNSLPEGVRSDS